MTNKLYQQLETIYHEAKKENPDFLQRFTDDLYKHDKDNLELDSQAGDNWIGILKAGGAGTGLARCMSKSEDDNYARIIVKDSFEGSRYFHIKATGNNEGTITEVNRDEALRLATSFETPHRVPRRMSVNRRLEQVLGLDASSESTFSRLTHSSFGQFTGADGEISAFKVGFCRATSQGYVEVARTRVNPENDTASMHKHYVVPIGIEKMTELSEPKYFKVETKSWPYAEFTEISKRVFDNAKKKAITPKESSLSL